ncbi:MAG: S8 family serine peptidase [Actinobacteria bacterium]|nr:S8 family serine peptidase [Actinomycetota bacterium]
MTRNEGIGAVVFRTLSVAVALAIVLALAPASSGADTGRAARRLAKGTSKSPFRTASELRTAAAEEGSVRVIVGLESSFAPEGGLSSKRVAAQRSGIRDVRQALLRDLGGSRYEVVRRFDSIPYVAMEVSAAALARLEASGAVSSVTEDAALPPLLAESVPLIQGPTMWSAGFTGVGQTVAVLDTGVESAHSFFGGRVVSEACYSRNDSCPNGLDSQTGPGAAVPCTYAPEQCLHGTHVAGIAAGSGVPFSGVAKEASIIAVQVFSEITGADCGGGVDPCALSANSDQIAGLERVYSLRNNYDIASVNLSLGGGVFTGLCDDESPAYKAIVANLRSVDIATVVAAGNAFFVDAIGFPACLSNVVSVGSTTKTDQISPFSNLSYVVSLLAPGSDINSSVPGNSFAILSGTSMAAPHVAGAWALLKNANPGATVGEILSSLQATGTLVTDARLPDGVTKPRINIADASALLGTGAPLPEITGVKDAPDPFTPLGRKHKKVKISWVLPQYVQGFSISIYKKSGVLVTTLYDGDLGVGRWYTLWNGRANGRVVRAGTYIYILRAVDDAGNVVTKQGKTTLKR